MDFKLESARLTAAEVLQRSGLPLPPGTEALTAAEVQDVLAAYLVQPVRSQGRYARFKAPAEQLAARAGEPAMRELVDSMLPPERLSREPLLAHPEWILLLARFGSAPQIRQMMACIYAEESCPAQERRILKTALRAAVPVSPYWEVILRGLQGRRPDERYYRERFRLGPWASCMPEGAPVGPDGTGTVHCQGDTVCLRVSASLQLLYAESANGPFHSYPPAWLERAGRKDPLWRQQQRELRSFRLYLRGLQHWLQELLDQAYFRGLSMSAAHFRHLTADPLLAAYCCGIVFRQDGTDFLLTPDGLQRPDGSRALLTDAEVSVPHPVRMDASVLEAFRSLPAARSSRLTQLREPVYSTEDALRMTGYPDCVQPPREPGQPPRVCFHRRLLPRAVRLGMPSKAAAQLFEEGDPVCNYLMYLADMRVRWQRIRRNDVGVVPLLLLDENPRQYLDAAIEADAAGIVAALLDELDGNKPPDLKL